MIQTIADVTSLDLPGIVQYRSLRQPLLHRKQGLFIVEGDKVVASFLASELAVVSVLATSTWIAAWTETLQQRPEQIAVYRASAELLEQIVGFRYHQGVMALGRVPQSNSLEEIVGQSPNRAKLFVALEQVTSAENTGAIVRNCAACGVDALIIGETSADPYLRRAVRNSMGTVFSLPLLYAESLSATLQQLQSTYKFSIVAAHPRKDSVPMHLVDFRGNCCLVFGTEGTGLSEAVATLAATAAVIPMAQGVDSFNVACANAILLYETFRQRYL